MGEIPALRGARPGGACVAHVSEGGADGGGEGVFSDVGAGGGSVDHDAEGDDEADVVDAVGPAAEEDEIARFEGHAGRQHGPGVVLVLGDLGEVVPAAL